MWDTGFFSSLRKEGGAYKARSDWGSVCCVSRVLLLCDTSPRMENPRALFQRDSDSWRLFPSFTSLFLLAIIASRKQGRPCKMSARHKIFDAK